MHLTILSRGASVYTTRRLVEAARERGHRVRVVDPTRCELRLGGDAPELSERGRRLPHTDAVIPRIAASAQGFGLAVLQQLELAGVPTLNDAASIALSRNKMRCLQVLDAAGVPVPPTVMARDAGSIKKLVRDVGGVPVLVKLAQGAGTDTTGGERPGVIVCESEQSLEAALEAVLSTGRDIVVQRYVQLEQGRDVRALVVGHRVIAAVRRRTRPGRLATTLGRGAQVTPWRCDAEHERLAIRATELLGLEIAAVDMLGSAEGPKVFDVTPSPGLKDLERATRLDLASQLIARAEALGRRAHRAVAR